MRESKFNSIQSNKVIIFVELFLNYFPAVLTFLLPLFFLTLFTDFFGQSKFVLFLVGTVFMSLFWTIKLLLRKRVSVTKSKLDLPLWVYLLVFALSTILSTSQIDSLYGTQFNWVPSLIALITMVLYFYTVASNIRSLQAIKFSIYGLILSSTVASLVSILYYYGIRFGNEAYLQNRNFNPLGSIENLNLVATISLLLCLNIVFNTKDRKNKIFAIATSIINAIAVTLTYQIGTLVVLVIGLIYILFNINSLKKLKVELGIIFGVLSVWLFLFFNPLTANLIQRESFFMEPKLDLRSSWIVTARTLTERPVWGAGANNFDKYFRQFMPLELNNTEFADYDFQNPYNQVFNELFSLGILGGLVGLFFYFRLYQVISDLYSKKGELTPIHQALLIPIVGVSIYHLFAVANLITYFIFFNFLGIFIGLIAGFHKNRNSEDIFLSVTSFSTLEVSDAQEGKEKFQYFAMVPLLGIAGAISYYSYFNIAGEYYFRQSINSMLSNDTYGIYNNQILARNVFPRRDAYHSAIADTNLGIAISLSSKKDLSDQEKEAVQTLISEAIRSTRIATENLGPFSLSNWLVRASVYRSLIGVTEDAQNWAIAALNNAITLDPTNANLRLDLGSIYFAQKDYITAANLFRQATELRYNSPNAHYNLAQALKGAEVRDVALRELEITKSLLAANSPDLPNLEKEIEALKKELSQVAGASTEKKSVEQLENLNTNSSSNQPLTDPKDFIKESQALENAVKE